MMGHDHGAHVIPQPPSESPLMAAHIGTYALPVTAHTPHCECAGTSPRRIVPGHLEERAHPPESVQNSGRGSPRHPALDRSLVQPPAPPLGTRIRIAIELGGPLPSHHQHHGRITIVSGQRGELQVRPLDAYVVLVSSS